MVINMRTIRIFMDGEACVLFLILELELYDLLKESEACGSHFCDKYLNYCRLRAYSTLPHPFLMNIVFNIQHSSNKFKKILEYHIFVVNGNI